MSFIVGYFVLFLLLGYLFLAIFCPIKSVTSKTNLYGIPAGLAFIMMSVIMFLVTFEHRINSFDYLDGMDLIVSMLYFLQYTVFFPLFGILILSKASRGSLLAPIILLTLPYTFSFFNNIDYLETIDITLYLLWLFAYISLIVLIFARKYLKYAFFVPALFMLINLFVEYSEYGMDIQSIMSYDFWIITGFLLLGLYVVCDYPEKVNVAAPVYTPAPQPMYTNYPPQNSGNNYASNNYKPQQTDIVQELAKYKDLLDKGLITKEDYEEKKARILGL